MFGGISRQKALAGTSQKDFVFFVIRSCCSGKIIGKGDWPERFVRLADKINDCLYENRLNMI